MDAWMHYERMLRDVFRQPTAYPYPFGSTTLGWLYEVSDADLRRLSYPRLGAQAVSVDEVFAEWKGRYLALWYVAERQGLTPYLDRLGIPILRWPSRLHGAREKCMGDSA